MAGISHLYDIYNKKGEDFINSLFNSYVTVNEKMDGSAFVFERDLETGRFNFYKRDLKYPITLVDRTLMKYYEKPINYIESFPLILFRKFLGDGGLDLNIFQQISQLKLHTIGCQKTILFFPMFIQKARMGNQWKQFRTGKN